MAEEVVSLCASGGHLGVTRLLSLTCSLPARIHCQAFHKHCLNYISKVAVVRGVKRKRRHRGKASETGFNKKKTKKLKNKEPVPERKREKWVLDKSFGPQSEMQES